jgi:hypothetical protein
VRRASAILEKPIDLDDFRAVRKGENAPRRDGQIAGLVPNGPVKPLSLPLDSSLTIRSPFHSRWG